MGGEAVGEDGEDGRDFFLPARQDGLMGGAVLLRLQKGTGWHY